MIQYLPPVSWRFLLQMTCMIFMTESYSLSITCHSKVQIAAIWRKRSSFFRNPLLGGV
jgi:hypothetical protein